MDEVIDHRQRQQALEEIRENIARSGQHVYMVIGETTPGFACTISEAITDVAALRGDRITEACRWEENEWELFAGAGPDVAKEEMRVVSLGTLLAADSSLEAVLTLTVGTGLWRDAISDWHPWIPKGQTT